MWDKCSLTRNWICCPCSGRWNLNHWITRRRPVTFFFPSWYCHLCCEHQKASGNNLKASRRGWEPCSAGHVFRRERGTSFDLLASGLLRWLIGKEPTCQCRRHGRPGFDPWVWKIPWRGHGKPLQDSCLENPTDEEALAGYSPWGCKESDMTEHAQDQGQA